jgi:hypothetical protein
MALRISGANVGSDQWFNAVYWGGGTMIHRRIPGLHFGNLRLSTQQFDDRLEKLAIVDDGGTRTRGKML